MVVKVGNEVETIFYLNENDSQYTVNENNYQLRKNHFSFVVEICYDLLLSL
jgi:hypothetical protein